VGAVAQRGLGASSGGQEAAAANRSYTIDTSELGLIVGIGTPAGGLQAFTNFFASMPPDSGMACVLVRDLRMDLADAIELASFRDDRSVAISIIGPAEDGRVWVLWRQQSLWDLALLKTRHVLRSQRRKG
jgi:hypothetical protein